MTEVVQLAPAPEVTIPRYSIISGLTEKAIRRKIEEGKWLEGRQYHRRDGGIWIDIKGVSTWVVKGTA